MEIFKKFMTLIGSLLCTSLLSAQMRPIDDLFNQNVSTRAQNANDTVYVDMSKYSGLERSTPLVAQDGRVYKFTNGQLTRLEQLNNSAMVVAKNGSTLVFSKNSVIYGGEFKTGYPIVAAEGGTIKMEGGTITSYIPKQTSGNSGGELVLKPSSYQIIRDYAIGMEPSNYQNDFIMTSGVIAETWGIFNNSGSMTIKGGSIYIEHVGYHGTTGWAGARAPHVPMIRTKSNVSLSGNATVPSIDFDDPSAHLILTSSLKNPIKIWCQPKDYSESDTRSVIRIEKNNWDFDGRVVVENLIIYLFSPQRKASAQSFYQSAIDLITMDYGFPEREWTLVQEDNKIVIREKKSDKIDTEDKLIAAINAATSGTSKEPISIEIAADIYLTKTINIENRYIKLTGGYRLIRSKEHKEILFSIAGGEVALENIIIDGNKSAFGQNDYVKTAFELEKTTLSLEKGGVITNHVVNHDHDGVVTSILNWSTFRMNGGEIKNNDLGLSTLIALYNGSFNFSSGSIHDNVATYGIVETSMLWMTGGEIYDNICKNYGINLTGNSSDHTISGGRIDAGQGGIWASKLFVSSPESVKDIISFKKDPEFYCFEGSIGSTLTFMPRSSKDEETFYEGMILLTGHDFTQRECDKVTLLSEKWKVELKPSALFKNRKDIVLALKQPEMQDIGDIFKSITDSGMTGTEADPIDICFIEDIEAIGVFGDPVDVPEDIHVLFGEKEDKPEGTEPTKRILVDNYYPDYVFKVPQTSSVEFKNIEIDFGNQTLSQFIYVDGTVIFNVNVTFVNVFSYIKYIIYVRKGGKVIWRGGRHNLPGIVIVNEGGTVTYEGGEIYGGEHGISNPGGIINITDGTIGGRIHGIHGDGVGSIFIRGGHIYGGGTSEGVATGSTADGGHAIYNGPYSGLYIYDGTFDDGSSIWSEGTLTIDGRINVRDIYIRRNTYITVVSRIVVNWYIHFINTITIDMSIPLIYGGDGYLLTEDDLSHLHVDLPSGYYLKLDTRLNAIIIVDYDPAGIDYVGADQVEDTYYSVDGVRKESLGRGLNIIKSSDGTIKKIMQ